MHIYHSGKGVFERSVAALLKLNKAGYGSKDQPELELDLVYNPGELLSSLFFVNICILLHIKFYTHTVL